MLGGCQYSLEQRNTFGDEDMQHVIHGRNFADNTQCVVAHSDFYVLIVVSDPEEGQQVHPLACQAQALMEAYKQNGY